MKKMMMAAAALLLSLPLFYACGGSGSSEADDAIAAAEKEVAIEQSDLWGAIPSLQIQYKAARKNVKEVFKAQRDKLLEGASEDNAGEVMKKGKALNAQNDTAEARLKGHYEAKLEEAAKAIAGKEVPCEWNKEAFSNVTAVIKANDSEITYRPVVVELSITLAAPFKSSAPSVTWRFLDAAGEEITPMAEYLERKEYKAGDVVTIKSFTPTGEQLSRVAKITIEP